MISYMVVEGEDISSQEEGVMKEPTKDGWWKPRSIYRSFFGSGVLTVGVIAIVCLVVVVICHLFETPTPEVNVLWYTYAHAGIILLMVLLFMGVALAHCRGKIIFRTS